MSWRDDDQDFFSDVAGGKTTEQLPGPCEMCTTTCLRCAMPLHQHTQAGLIECAWRGYPCEVCGQPPHPDNAEGRCARYQNVYDTDRERQLRAITPWSRDAAGPFYVYRHCSHRHHGRPEANPESKIHDINWPKPTRRDENDLQRIAAEQVAQARAAR